MGRSRSAPAVSYNGILRRPRRPNAALLSTARSELLKGLRSQRPNLPGAFPARFPPDVITRSTPRCGRFESRGARKASTSRTTHITITAAISMPESVPVRGAALTGTRPKRGGPLWGQLRPAERPSIDAVLIFSPVSGHANNRHIGRIEIRTSGTPGATTLVQSCLKLPLARYLSNRLTLKEWRWPPMRMNAVGKLRRMLLRLSTGASATCMGSGRRGSRRSSLGIA
jgi:hypothetical protein